MSIEMNHAEKKVFSLLKYLHDTNKNLKISRHSLQLLVLSMVEVAVQEMIDVENPDMDMAREASKIQLESVLTKLGHSDVNPEAVIAISSLTIPIGVEPLSDKDVLRILKSGISMEKAKACTRSDPDKDIVLIFWKLWEPLCREISDIISELLTSLSTGDMAEVTKLQRIRDLKNDCDACAALAPSRIAELS